MLILLIYSTFPLYILQSSFDWLMIGFHIVAMFTSLIWPYLFSYFATFVTNRISFIGDTAYNTNWFDYPTKLQEHFILIIARSQGNAHFTGFNLIQCTLENFAKVKQLLFRFMLIWMIIVGSDNYVYFQLLKTSCTCYMIFRSFSQR